MKKLLTLLGAVGLVATSSATVVSCNDVASFKGYSGSIIENLETETFFIPDAEGSTDGTQVNMADHFDTIGKLKIDRLSDENFRTAVNNSVNAVVESSEKDDYTLDITKFAEAKSDDTGNYIEIVLTASENSKAWQGTATIDLYLSTESAMSYMLNGGAN